MKCKVCKNQIPDGSIFCNWCGERQIKERKTKGEIRIPTPRLLPSGRWNIQLREEKQSITEDTKDLCIAKAKSIRAGFIAAKPKVEDVTLRQLCTRYIESKSARLAPSTKHEYERLKDQYFQGIMDMSVSGLTRDVLDNAMETECKRLSIHGKPLAPKTIINAWMLIASTLKKYAPSVEYQNVTIPEQKKLVPVIIPPEQLYPVIKGTDIELPCLLAMWLSLSMSEIKGLTKSKSIVNGQLVISETVVKVGKEEIRRIGGKEEKRTRALNIPPYIMALIDQVEGDIIVPASGRSIYARFSRILEKSGLPHISFHRLRHINASVMAMLNIPDTEANERGGWISDYTRKRVYTHSFTEQRIAADQKIDRYFDDIIQSRR